MDAPSPLSSVNFKVPSHSTRYQVYYIFSAHTTNYGRNNHIDCMMWSWLTRATFINTVEISLIAAVKGGQYSGAHWLSSTGIPRLDFPKILGNIETKE
ncbi:hypothetical protein QTP88_003723 [Uroleucon formosanum]